MLAAGWGRTIDASWQDLWIKAGAAGLIAAVVLERTERVHLRRQARTREETARLVSELRLERLNEHQITRNSVMDAIHELATYAGPDLNEYPLRIIPVKDGNEAFEINFGDSISGEVLNISSNSVSFKHDETFDEPIVMLKFNLHKHKPLCFVVEMIGTQRLDTGFTSSGAVLAAGVPIGENADADPAKTLQNA
jgi:hypothetical protein